MLYLLKLVAIQSVYHPVEAPLSRLSKLSLIDLEGIAMIRLRDLRRRIQTLKSPKKRHTIANVSLHCYRAECL